MLLIKLAREHNARNRCLSPEEEARLLLGAQATIAGVVLSCELDQEHPWAVSVLLHELRLQWTDARTRGAREQCLQVLARIGRAGPKSRLQRPRIERDSPNHQSAARQDSGGMA